MAFDRAGAKAAGYTDEEIEAYIAANPEVASEAPPPGEEPPAPEPIYNEPGERGVLPAGMVPEKYNPSASTVGTAAVGAGGLGLAKGLLPKVNVSFGGGSPSSGPVAPTPTPSAPVAPAPVKPGLVDAQGRPLTPESPAQRAPRSTTRLPSGTLPPQAGAAPKPAIGGPAAAEGSNFIQSLAQKYGPAVSRAGVGAAAMLTPGNIGQNYNVPTKGPLRGSEINPSTGRAWTPEEAQHYSSWY